MTLRIEVDLKQTALTAFKAHEFEAIVRKLYAWFRDDTYNAENISAWVIGQYESVVVRYHEIDNAWPHIEPFIQDNDEDKYTEWCHNHFYGTAWNSQADAYVRESFRKIQLSLGRKA